MEGGDQTEEYYDEYYQNDGQNDGQNEYYYDDDGRLIDLSKLDDPDAPEDFNVFVSNFRPQM